MGIHGRGAYFAVDGCLLFMARAYPLRKRQGPPRPCRFSLRAPRASPGGGLVKDTGEATHQISCRFGLRMPRASPWGGLEKDTREATHQTSYRFGLQMGVCRTVRIHIQRCRNHGSLREGAPAKRVEEPCGTNDSSEEKNYISGKSEIISSKVISSRGLPQSPSAPAPSRREPWFRQRRWKQTHR